MKFRKKMDYTYEADGAKRRRRRLLEFLQQRFSQQRQAEEETSSRNLEMETQNHQVTLSEDIIFKILVLLPADSLFRFQLVCKKWFDLINNSVFITSHAQQSETVLICKKLTLGFNDGDSKFLELGRSQKSYFQFLDFNDGDSKFIESSLVESLTIHASCDGLTLATVGDSKSLMLINPITRHHIDLPLGRNDNLLVESFGMAFCNEAKTYKVVHLFRETSSYICCEILNVHSRKWTRIEGPSSESLIYIRDTPVSIHGSFYWLPHEVRHDYFVSMSLKDEVFVSKKLPVTFVSKDRLMKIGGSLGFVTHAQPGVLQVWILIKGDGLEEDWMKRYTMELVNFGVAYPIPVCSSRNGKDLVLGSSLGSDLYVYNFETKVVKSTYDDEEWLQSIDEHYIPHTHTLLSMKSYVR